MNVAPDTVFYLKKAEGTQSDPVQVMPSPSRCRS